MLLDVFSHVYSKKNCIQFLHFDWIVLNLETSISINIQIPTLEVNKITNIIISKAPLKTNSLFGCTSFFGHLAANSKWYCYCEKK